MSRRFVPRGDWVLVRPETKPVKSKGLATAPSQLEEPTVGEVLAAGHEALRTEMMVDPERGYEIVGFGRNPHGVKVGDIVQWRKHSGHEVTVNGEKLRQLRLEEIEGTWEEVGE